MKNFTNALIASILFVPAIFVSCKKPVEGIKADSAFSIAPAGNSLLTAERQTLTLTFSSLSAWNLSSNQSWITASAYSGAAGQAAMTFNIDANGGANSRAAVLTVTDSGTGTELKKIYVFQLGTSGNPVVAWIYDRLKTEYYWNIPVQDATALNPDLAYNMFLTNLIVGLRGAKDDDGTIDGGYNNSNQRYVYSYIEDKGAATRADVDEFNDYTYGFDFTPFWYDNTMQRVVCFVKWVREGSAAEAGGLKRGMWIAGFNDQTLTEAVYSLFVDAYYDTSDASTLNVTTEDGTEVTMTIEGTTELTPIIKSTTVNSPDGKKVAYFMYNQFELGAQDGNEYKFNTDMRADFKGFKDSGVDALVVDLRYNPGGYTYCCRILTSLAADVNNTQVFNEMRRNSSITVNNPEIERFFNETNSLKFKKIYVLATVESASSSELFINSLRGVGIEVVQIGETTEGKNVGMHSYETVVGGREYEMWPITFKSYNAAGKTNSPNGMKPDYEVSDYAHDVIYDLGDPREALLKVALDLIDGKVIRTSGKSRGESGQQRALMENTLKRRQLDGARIFPGEIEGIYLANP